MIRTLVKCVALAGVAFLAGCGSEGGSGGGPTTYLTVGIKTGTSSAAFVTFSSATKFRPGTLSFVVNSNIYTGVTPSNVQITKQTLNYTPLPFETYSGSKQRMSPTFTTLPVVNPVPLLIPGGSNGGLDNYPVFSANEFAELAPLTIGDPRYSGKLLRYQLDMKFEGYEVQTNEPVSGTINSLIQVMTP